MIIVDFFFIFFNAFIGASNSILLFVVISSEPDVNILLLLESKIMAAHPPFPGFPIQEPSV